MSEVLKPMCNRFLGKNTGQHAVVLICTVVLQHCQQRSGEVSAHCYISGTQLALLCVWKMLNVYYRRQDKQPPGAKFHCI